MQKFGILLLLTIAISSNSETVTDLEFILSHATLKQLAKAEEEIYEFVKSEFSKVMTDNEMTSQEMEVSVTARYLADFEGSSGKVKGGSDARTAYIGSHPLLSFRLIYRLITDLAQLTSQSDYLRSRISSIITANKVGWPAGSDLEEAMGGILRVLHVHDFDLEEFATGIINERITSVHLTARHVYAIGTFALKEGKFFALAVECLEYAKFLVDSEDDDTIDRDTVTKELLDAVSIHDRELDETPGYAETFFTRKIVRRKGDAYEFDGFVRRLKQRTFHYRVWKGNREQNYNEINYWGLCSGDNLQTDEEKSKLSCWYDRSSNPAWTIWPVPIELISQSPHLVQIYNVLSASDIQEITTKTEPELRKSKVFDSNHTGSRRASSHRTSLNTWLMEAEAPELYHKISRRIEMLTGLSVVPTRASEILQIASYSHFGHYSIHMDSMRDPNEVWYKQKGDRIATFMIYLSVVEEGGYTAFPTAGTAAKPVKGSAVFWYNLKGNGEPDERTYHGACPVLLGGNKWVANKWVRSKDQFQTRRCSLDPNL